MTAMLVFGRMGGLMLSLPVFTARGVPKHVPILGAAALTAVVAPAAPLAESPGKLGLLLLGMAGEVLLGLLMGAVVAAVFGAFSLATELMEQQIGSRIPVGPDPFMAAQQGPIGTLATWLASLSFIGAGLHTDALRVVGASFHYLAPGQVSGLTPGGMVLLEAVSWSLVLGVRLAAPVLALVWLVNVFVALLVKLAPNMNVFFSIGMVLTNAGGTALLGLALPYLLLAHATAMQEALTLMTRLLSMAGS